MSLKRSVSLLIAVAVIAVTSVQSAGAQTLPPISDANPGFVKVESEALNSLWQRRPVDNNSHRAIVQFKLGQNGEILSEPDAVTIYQSSGNRDLDDYAVYCIKNAAPYALSQKQTKSLAEHDYICLAKMDNFRNVAFFSGKYKVDYFRLAVGVQEAIENRFLEVTQKKPRRTVCQFSINSDGTISDTAIAESSGSKQFDGACLANVTRMHAIEASKIPVGAPDKIPTRIDFEYQPAGDAHKSSIWMDGALQLQLDDPLPDKFADPVDETKVSAKAEIAGKEKYAFMADAQSSIKRHWLPARRTSSYFVKCLFVLDKKRQLISNDVIASSGASKEDERSCLKAINEAAPFTYIPKIIDKKSEKIRIEFSFSYNNTHVLHPTALVRKTKTVDRPAVVPIYMTGYLVRAQNKIENNWRKKGNWLMPNAVQMQIAGDGTIQSFELQTVTGDNAADLALIKAVKEAGSLGPLPKEAGDNFDANLSFTPANNPPKQKAAR